VSGAVEQGSEQETAHVPLGVSLADDLLWIRRSRCGETRCSTAGWDLHHPFGGFRESGSPFREQGAPGIRFYSRIKTAAVRFN
jgi:acyl-CoA reductase-like NAD-dependent aldehyde dehydrogenase